MAGGLPPGDPFAPPPMDPTNPYGMPMMAQRVSSLSNQYRALEERRLKDPSNAGFQYNAPVHNLVRVNWNPSTPQGLPMQGMHPDMTQGPHIPPRSMSLQRGPHQMPPPHPGMGMMGSSNPYGPSGPLPPNMGGGGQMMPPVPMRPSMNPVSQKLPNPLNNIQLQQLSAQIKAYRMLSRSMTPPEALISIVQGRKPTAAMLGSLGRGNTAGQQAGIGGYPGVPSPAGSSSAGGRESPAQTNISLYPPSPSTGGVGPSDGATPPINPTSHRMQSHTSGAAPNVTLQPGGELPPQVL